MTADDINKIKELDPELVGALENGAILKAPKYLELFHMYQQLDNHSKIKFIELIENTLKDE
jgi:hypothetical protein